MNTNLLFSFIDEIKSDHNAFIEKRINIDPIKRDKLIELIKKLGLTLQHANAHMLLKLHAKTIGKPLDEEFAERLLGHENMQAVIKNKNFFFDGIKDEEDKARILQRLLTLNVKQIEDIIVAMKKAPILNEKIKTSSDLQFDILHVLKSVGSHTCLARADIAAKLGLDQSETTMHKLTTALMALADSNKIKFEGERGSRRYSVSTAKLRKAI